MTEHLGSELMLEHLGPKQMLEHLDMEKLLAHLGHEQFLDLVQIATKLKKMTVGNLLEQFGINNFLKGMPPGRILDFLTLEQMLERLKPGAMLDHLTGDQLLNYLDSGELPNHLTAEQILRHFGIDIVLGAIEPQVLIGFLAKNVDTHDSDPSKVVEQEDVLELLKAVDLDGEIAANIIATDVKAAEAVVKNTHALKQVITTPLALHKVKALQGIERASTLPYSLPVAVVACNRTLRLFLFSPGSSWSSNTTSLGITDMERRCSVNIAYFPRCCSFCSWRCALAKK